MTYREQYMRNLGPNALEGVGFRNYGYKPHDGSLALQLRVLGDDEETKYFVNARYHFVERLPADARVSPVVFEAHLYLPYKSADYVRFDLAFYPEPDHKIDAVLAFFEKAYRSMGCVPDPLSQ